MIQSMTRKEAATTTVVALTAPTSIASARVTRDMTPRGVEVEVGTELIPTQVAFSCLVRPVAGDRVLLSRGAEGVFVLAVLERLLPDRATLALPSGGALAIEAEGVSLVARKEFSIDSDTVSVRSQKFRVVADSLTLFGRIAHWVAEHIAISAKAQETVADMVSVKALDRVSVVERTDVLKAGSLSQSIDDVAMTTAPVAVIATSEDLRLDGKRVTVG
jgi:hypothetical protein